jgi:diguanylate cyclase (GGDEF)-like protein/PAS domain S-box-containing protein
MSLIVIVDDQGINQRIYAKLAELTEQHVKVKTFGSPFDLLEWVSHNTPDLIITDFKMPGIDGADLTRRLRQLPDVSDTPIIVLTAYEDRSFRLNALEAGATDFMQTPINHDEFVSRARNLLKLRHQQQSIKQDVRKLERRLRASERSLERATRHSNEQLAQVIDTVPALISATDRDSKCVFVNAMFAIFAGRDPADCVGHSPLTLLSLTDAERYQTADQVVLDRGEMRSSYEEQLHDPTGNVRTFLVTKAPLFDQSGAVTGVLTTLLDITDQKMANERLRHLAQYDALTGLPNRTFLAIRLQQVISERTHPSRLSALHLLDLDRFKSINDTLGHFVGDQLLQVISQHLEVACGKNVTVARLGGDEFALLQEEMILPEEAETLATRILASLSKPLKVGNHLINTTASLGIAFVGHDGSDVNEILKNADMAMYQAKLGGRNGYHIFAEDLRMRAEEHAWLEAGMRRALEQKEFVLYYQPQVHLKTNRIIGVEALIRWNHPERGLLMPGTFLHIAEESGLIAEISAWVIHEACEQLAAWQDRSIRGLRMAINVSPSHFNSAKTWDTLADALTKAPIDPAFLELELTENAFAGHVEDAALNIKLLKKTGISVALDDFGTGFSSLRLAKELPVDAIKIDRSFVKNLPWSKEDSAITQSIIRLAHGLDLRVVAEGVENQEQLAYLLKEGCDEIQGYYISRAVPAEECLEIILRQDLQGIAT